MVVVVVVVTDDVEVVVVVVAVFFSSATAINVAIVPRRASKINDSNKQGSTHSQDIAGIHLNTLGLPVGTKF